ncbi:MAG TPA: glycosyltransferase family 4 protein [Micromonosporaceae bacterium]
MSQPPPEPPRPLRIAMVVPPWYELPPHGYGGLEHVCSALIDALVARGHQVTLLGAGTRTGTSATAFVSTSRELQHARLGQTIPELAHLARADRIIAEGDFDIVHDHTTAGPLLAPRRRVPTVVTVHGRPVGELGDLLADVDPLVGLVAISTAQCRIAPQLPWAAVVHHGLPADDMTTDPTRGEGPVLWLARFTPDKGPDLAIQACRAAGLPLVLAGKANEVSEQRYLREVIEPMLGPDVTLLRNAARDHTMALLRDARCLIMPIRWEEPFGMVMLEAMAAGTPVVALRRGAVPELVAHGRTGLVCDDPDELPEALRNVAAIDPRECVRHVRERFSAERMAEGYERVYRRWATDRSATPTAEGLLPSGAW